MPEIDNGHHHEHSSCVILNVKAVVVAVVAVVAVVVVALVCPPGCPPLLNVVCFASGGSLSSRLRRHFQQIRRAWCDDELRVVEGDNMGRVEEAVETAKRIG